MSIISGAALDPEEYPHIVPVGLLTDDSIVDIFMELVLEANMWPPDTVIMLSQTDDNIVSSWLRPAPAAGGEWIVPYSRSELRILPLCFQKDDSLAWSAAEYIVRVSGLDQSIAVPTRLLTGHRPPTATGLSCLAAKNLSKDRASADVLVRGLGVWSEYTVRAHSWLLRSAIPDYYPILKAVSIDTILLIDLCYNISPLRYAWWHNLSVANLALETGLLALDETGVEHLRMWFRALPVPVLQLNYYIRAVLAVSIESEYESIAIDEVRHRLIEWLDSGANEDDVKVMVKITMSPAVWRKVQYEQPRLEALSRE